MSLRTEYWPGGFDAAAPANNKSLEWDGAAGTATTWGLDGTLISQRALTVVEQALMAAADDQNSIATNRASVETKAVQALTANATFLALASPTNAQTLAQVKTLTRECNGLIRLLLGLFDDMSGT
jgi:hypothetical protein